MFYFDMNTATDLPHNKDRDEYILKFERQDGFDKPVLDFDELTMNADDIMCSEVIDNYATGLASNVKNLSAGTVVTFPAENLFAVPEVDADVRDTTGYTTNGDNWVIRTPFPIKRVVSVRQIILVANTKGTVGGTRVVKRTNSVIDAKYLLERKQHIAQDDYLSGDYFWFQEGQNTLHIRGYVYLNPRVFPDKNCNNILYQIQYEPLIDCRVLIGNSEFVQQVNQSSAQVDSKKYGGFLSEMLKSMGKADISFGKNYSGSPKRFQHLIGSRVKRGDREYLITNMSYRNRRFQYYVAFQLNENHVRKNSSYQAPQTVRADIAISTDSVKERMSSIQQIIKIGLTPQVAEGYQFLFGRKKYTMFSALQFENTINNNYYPQIVLTEMKSNLKSSSGANVEYTESYLAAISRCVLDDSLVLTYGFYDNALAGWRKESEKTHSGSPSGAVEDNRYITRVKSQFPVLFTDPFGETQILNTYISNTVDQNLGDIDDGNASQTLFDSTLNAYHAMRNYPYVDPEEESRLKSSAVITCLNQQLLKDQLESFGNSIVLQIQASSELIVCESLLLLSRLNKRVDDYKLSIVTFDRKISRNDSDATGRIEVAKIFSTGLSNYDEDTYITHGFILQSAAKSAIIYANNQKLLIINKDFSVGRQELKYYIA